MITFKQVQLAFAGQKILDNISFAVLPGEKVVVLAKSGAGKSSLFSLILGFLQPDAGEVLVSGRPVDDQRVWEIRQKTAYVDQNFSLGEGKFSDLLDFMLGLKSNSRLDNSREQLRELLDCFELDQEIVKQEIETLSGGERQRLAIILAVLLQRELFLLDEVTSALDKHLKRKVADFFMNRKEWTCLVISHDPVWLEHPAAKIFDLENKRWKP